MVSMAEKRGLPANVESEQVLLWAAMEMPMETRRLVSELSADDFSLSKHQQAWHVITDLAAAGRQVSRVLVVEELSRRGRLEAAGGFAYLASLDGAIARVMGPDEYVAQVRDAAVRRRVMVECQSLIDRCVTEDAESVQAAVESMRAAIAERVAESSGSGLKHASQVLREAGGPGQLFAPSRYGLQMPWTALNRLTMGVHPGQMVVLAARTGKGKSAAAAQIAEYATRQQRGAVAVFSMEMRAEANLSRMTCATAGVNAGAVRRGDLSPQDRAKLQSSALAIASQDLWFSDAMRVTVPTVYRALQFLRYRSPLALGIVDYLQLMGGATKAETRQQEIAAISRGLKMAAVEFDIPMLVLCQYNREADRGETRPALHHIRESGAIGHDADQVWLFHEPEGITEAGWVTELIVEKQREGPTGSIRLWFDRAKTRFVEPGSE
jgi:replicative DNA helicase